MFNKMEKCEINSAIAPKTVVVDSKSRVHKVLETGNSKMNRTDIRLLNTTTDYRVELKESDSEIKGWVLDIVLCSDSRRFTAVTSRGNVRIFKTLETALSFVFEECPQRKSLTFEFNKQLYKVSPTGVNNEKI